MAIEASASFYTKFNLRFYNFIVLTLSNAFAWRCSTTSVLLPFYQQHLPGSVSASSSSDSSAHLEIGVGTGYYLAASARALAQTRKVMLVDLNPNTLVYAKARLVGAGYQGAIETLEHNVFQPLPEDLRGAYDSIALYYLFHCLPGSFPKKATDVFMNAIPALAPGGVLYGSTILSTGHNWLGTRLMGLYNRKGIFGNLGDTEEGLKQALEECFEEYEVKVVGVVALFSGRKPKAVKH